MSNIPKSNNLKTAPVYFDRIDEVRKPEESTGLIVGVVGGIGSGKSEVSAILERYGAVVFVADKVGHQLLLSPEIRERIIQVFGTECLDANGVIDRKQLAKCFFSGPNEQLSKLEAILHPVIRQEAIKLISDFRKDPSKSLLILDAPLLLEAGWQFLCDKIIFVDTPFAKRLKNVEKRGWSESELIAREKTQISLEEKKKNSTDVVSNEGSLEDLHSNLMRLPWLARMHAKVL